MTEARRPRVKSGYQLQALEASGFKGFTIQTSAVFSVIQRFAIAFLKEKC